MKPCSTSAVDEESRWFGRHLEEPLGRFARFFPAGADALELARRTLDLVEPLRRADLPRPFEHGDLSYPNLLWLGDGRIGVLDWELADQGGLPLNDLSFFLAYVAFSARRARTLDAQLAAFREAFLAPEAWGRLTIGRHATRLGIARPLITPLFVACWARYTMRLLARLEGDPVVGENEVPVQRAESVAWIQGNRYYAIWRDALAFAGKLDSARWE